MWQVVAPPKRIQSDKSQLWLHCNDLHPLFFFSRSTHGLQTEAGIPHTPHPPSPRAPRGVGRHHSVCKTFFPRYPGKKRSPCVEFMASEMTAETINVLSTIKVSKVTYTGEDTGSRSFQNTVVRRFASGCLPPQKTLLWRFDTTCKTCYSYMNVYSSRSRAP